MKIKNLFLALSTVLSCVLFSSCQNDVSLYSCDPEVNSFVEENIEEIRLLTRADIVKLDPETSTACYRAFTAEQKLQVWNDKLSEVISMDWNEKETAHIKELIRFINDNHEIFSDNINENNEVRDALDIFGYKWMDYAEHILGWNRKLINAVSFTYYSLTDKEGNLDVNHIEGDNTVKTLRETNGCDCNIKQNDCEFSLSKRCIYSGCRLRGSGCGFTGQSICDGTCS